MRCLADAGHDVLVVTTETMSEDRLRLGWTVPSLGSARVVLNPSFSQIRDIVRESLPDSTHFIAGARGTTLGVQAAKACREYKRRAGIITEAPDMRGLRGMARWVKYWIERRRAGRQFDFLLAMGEKGIRWFRRFGYPIDRLFPFAYVTETVDAVDTFAGDQGRLKLLYAGQMIHRKGVDVLLRALAQVPRCELALIGSGPEIAALQALAEQLGVGERVSWMGQMHAERIPAVIINSDVFLLPSREDGWGAVVNESLMAGTPVICSDACGAAELIRQEWLGGVFRSGSVEDLAAVMEAWVGRVASGSGERERIRKWSKCIEGAAVAAYVEEILEHVYQAGPRPVAPWRKEMP